MASPPPPDETPPLGQRLFARTLLLLAAGLIAMFGFYTIWGLLEISSLPVGKLP